MSSQSSQLSEPSFICISSTTGSLSPSHSHLCIAALFFLNQIFQRKSLAKISMLHRKMIWIPNTSLHTDCGENKYQRLQWVCLLLGGMGVGGVVTATLLPTSQHKFYQHSYSIVNIFNLISDYENCFYSYKWSILKYTFHFALRPVFFPLSPLPHYIALSFIHQSF